MKTGITRCAAVVALTIGLGACGGVLQSDLFTESFWAASPLKENDEAELGLAEMAKGNYVAAEGHYQRALKANSNDVHALLGQGILYQSTGQTTKAREMYEAVLAIRPKDSQRMVIWNDVSTRPVAEIASVNLALLDSGGVLASMGRGPTGPQAQGERPVAPAPQPLVSGAPNGTAMLGRSLATPVTTRAPAMSMLANGDANIVSRFKTMRALRDQSLITQDEFATRRRANVGALLPLTSSPPAAGLDRPVPTTGQISGRLRAIGRALEMRAMSVSQHAAERSMILDALMPGAPVVVANPGKPPQGLMEAADAVRRLEQLQDGGFISSDEYARERKAIEHAMQPTPMVSKEEVTVASTVKAATQVSPAKAEGKAKAKAKGLLPAVHLASYRSRKAADLGWVNLRRAHREVLDNLEVEITKVNLGPRKGIFYRLKAGPVTDKAAAAEVCRKLKSRRQYCEPSFMNRT